VLNGLTLLVLIALVIGVVFAYRAGMLRGRSEGKDVKSPATTMQLPVSPPTEVPEAPAVAATPPPAAPIEPGDPPAIAGEKARLIVSYESEAAALRQTLATREAERTQLSAFAEDRRALERDLANARGEIARYRQLVIDIETNAPPPLLDGPGTPDDLKLIVGVGPVLERMLYQLGVSTFRQIARWSERDIDDFEARLPEFPGRIRRDQWVTQARTLHLSKYGEALPQRTGGAL